MGAANLGADVSRAANQSITGSTNTALSWDTTVRDDLGAFAAGNPTRLTVPTSGWYVIQSDVLWATNNSYKILNIKLNGTTFISRCDISGNIGPGQNATCIRYLTANDYVEAVVFQNGTTVNCTGRMALMQFKPVSLGTYVSRNAAQSPTINTNVAISFDTTLRNDLAAFAGGSPTRLTAPTSGWYCVATDISWNITTPYRITNLRVNGTTYVSRTDTTGQLGQQVVMVRYLTAADYVESVVFQNGAATCTGGGQMVF